jgi:hypothetical protein
MNAYDKLLVQMQIEDDQAELENMVSGGGGGVYARHDPGFGNVDQAALKQLVDAPVVPHVAPAPAQAPRSALGEVWSQLKAGTFIDLPRMAGRAMLYVSSPGNALYDKGKSLADDADAIEQYTPELAPSAASDRPVVGALAQGARMIPQSVAPAVGAGLALTGVGAPAGVALIGGSALAALPAGLAQGQETFEKGLRKHGLTLEQAADMPDDPRVIEARNAGIMNAAIEFGGETAGGALAGRFVGVGGKTFSSLAGKILNRGEQTAAQAVLKSFTAPQAVARFGIDLAETAAGETLTEMGQGAGEAAVEQAHGYDTKTPWVAAKEAIAPTLGMTALLAPFGIHGSVTQARQMANIVSALENPAVPQETRAKAAEIVYNELAKVSPDAAHNFALHSFDALHSEEDTGTAPYGLALDDSVVGPYAPRTNEATTGLEGLPAEPAAPSGPMGRAVTYVAPVAEQTPPPVIISDNPDSLSPGTLAAETVPTDRAPLEDVRQWASQQVQAGNTTLMQQTNEPESAWNQRLMESYSRAQIQIPGQHMTAGEVRQDKPTDKGWQVNPVRDDLVTAIAKLGGVDSGEVRQQLGPTVADDVKAINRQAFKGVGQFAHAVKKGGRALDTMRETLVEYGYLAPESTVNDLLDGIADAARGKARYSDQYLPDFDALAGEVQPFTFTPPAESRAAAPAQEVGELVAERRGRHATSPKAALPQRPALSPRDEALAAHYADQAGYDTTGWDDEMKAEFVRQYGAWLGTTHQPATPAALVVHAVTRKAVEAAFPEQTVIDDGDGYTVLLKNGATIRIAHTGEIDFNAQQAADAYGRQLSPTEKPVAAFQMLDRAAVVSLTDEGAGEIHHETFHAAMALALNSHQRAVILKKFGTEEAAAAEYQRLRDTGAFGEKSGHLFLRVIHRFFARIRSLYDQSHGVFADVATGQAWEQSGDSGAAAPVMYSLKELGEKLETVKGHISRYSDKSTFVKSDMKPALKAAGDGLAASWDGLKAAVNPMARSNEAEEAGRILIEGMGKQEHNREQFIARLNSAVFKSVQQTTRTARLLDLMQSSTTLADKVFNQMPEAGRIDFMQRMDTGQQQATPELQRIADTIKAMFSEKVEQVQALGIGTLEQARENYFPHIWERSEDSARDINSRLSKRPLEGSKGFAKARVFDDIMEGIDAGYTLLSTNPIDLAFLKMAEMDRFINAHVALQSMEESGLVQLIPAGERLPDGYGDISGRYGIVTKRGFIGPETGMEGEQKSYRYVAREDVAQVFNNYLSQNLYNNKYVGKPFTVYMAAANTLNQFQLGVFSAFHAGFTSVESVISHAALGIKALSRGDFKEAGKYLREAPAAAYLNPKLGDKVIRAWMGDPAAAKEMLQIVEWLEMAGARRTLEARFRTNQTQKMFQAWQDGNKAGAVLRGLPAIVEQSARPIMEWLVPRQKFGVFAEMANDWASRNPDASHEETRKAMQQMWNRVDSRLGQVVYDRLFVHNVAKNLVQAIIRAPGWTGGTVLEVGGGLKDLGVYARQLAFGKKPEMTDRAAYTLSMLVTTAVANALLTALFTGDPPKDWKDLIAFRTGNKDERGNPERFMLPTYMKDVYAYMEKPGTTLMHKTHPMLSLMGDAIRNQDYYGTEIRHDGDSPVMQLAQLGGFTAKAFVPFWMKGVAKEHERGGSVLSMAAPLIGVMPAPADLNKTEAEKMASDMSRARMPKAARTGKQFEASQLVMQLTNRLRRNEAGASQEITAALSAGKISRLQAMHIRHNARLDPIQVAFKRLTYDEAARVYEVANKEEKRLLRPMLAAKRPD